MQAAVYEGAAERNRPAGDRAVLRVSGAGRDDPTDHRPGQQRTPGCPDLPRHEDPAHLQTGAPLHRTPVARLHAPSQLQGARTSRHLPRHRNPRLLQPCLRPPQTLSDLSRSSSLVPVRLKPVRPFSNLDCALKRCQFVLDAVVRCSSTLFVFFFQCSTAFCDIFYPNLLFSNLAIRTFLIFSFHFVLPRLRHSLQTFLFFFFFFSFYFFSFPLLLLILKPCQF